MSETTIPKSKGHLIIYLNWRKGEFLTIGDAIVHIRDSGKSFITVGVIADKDIEITKRTEELE